MDGKHGLLAGKCLLLLRRQGVGALLWLCLWLLLLRLWLLLLLLLLLGRRRIRALVRRLGRGSGLSRRQWVEAGLFGRQRVCLQTAVREVGASGRR